MAILKQNHLDMHVLMLGIIRGGGMACPMNGNFSAAKVEPYLLNIGARDLVRRRADPASRPWRGRRYRTFQDVVLAARRGDIPDDAFAALAAAVHARHPQVSIHCIEDLLGAVEREHPALERTAREPLYLVHSSGTNGVSEGRHAPQWRAGARDARVALLRARVEAPRPGILRRPETTIRR